MGRQTVTVLQETPEPDSGIHPETLYGPASSAVSIAAASSGSSGSVRLP